MIEMTNNKLKIIAIITMIIDHIGFYFSASLNPYIYVIFRCIGRIAMPIFTFLIVEGYCYTKNFKKYILSIFSCAIITQIILYILDMAAKEKTYLCSKELNILFSFTISLIILKILEMVFLNSNIKNKVIFTLVCLLSIYLYKYIQLDYGIAVPVLCVALYFIRKLVKSRYIYNVLLVCIIYVLSIFLTIQYNTYFLFMNIVSIFLVMYNNKLGINKKIIKFIFYGIYPLQFLILYGIYILI